MGGRNFSPFGKVPNDGVDAIFGGIPESMKFMRIFPPRNLPVSPLVSSLENELDAVYEQQETASPLLGPELARKEKELIGKLVDCMSEESDRNETIRLILSGSGK
jgi:hypothetical protein